MMHKNIAIQFSNEAQTNTKTLKSELVHIWQTLKSELVHIWLVGISIKPETNYIPSRKHIKWYALFMGIKWSESSLLRSSRHKMVRVFSSSQNFQTNSSGMVTVFTSEESQSNSSRSCCRIELTQKTLVLNNFCNRIFAKSKPKFLHSGPAKWAAKQIFSTSWKT